MVNTVIELNSWPDVSTGQPANKYVSLSRAREEEFTDGVAPCAQHRTCGSRFPVSYTRCSSIHLSFVQFHAYR